MIGSPLYYDRKEEALAAGKAVLNLEFVETLAMVFEASEEISGGRAAELMEMVTHLLKCRKACEKHGLMRDILIADCTA
jgi:hypothetical protein